MGRRILSVLVACLVTIGGVARAADVLPPLAGLHADGRQGAHAGNADALPPLADLRADGRQAQREHKPLVLLFSLPGCDYCEVVRRNYLLPLVRDGSAGALIREAELTGDQALIGFDGAPTTPRQLAARYHVRVAPTVVFVDGEGHLLTAPLAGGDTSGMYGAYLDNAFGEARRKLLP